MHLGYHLYYTHLIEAVWTTLGKLNSAHLPFFLPDPKLAPMLRKS